MVQMGATVAAGGTTGVGIAAGKERKALTLPKDLIARVRAWRHARQIDPESEAYAQLLEKGLEASDREEREEKSGRKARKL
jgi:hypothetical protein